MSVTGLWIRFGILLAPVMAQAQDPPVIAATVDNQSITLAEVERVAAERTRGFRLSPEALAAARAEALRQLVGQVVVLAYLQDKNLALSADELQLEQERWQTKLAAVGKTWEDYLAEQQVNESAWQRQMQFRRSWERYLATMLTDANLQKHFERYQRDLDGTRLRVQHLLLPTVEAEVGEVRARAAALREDIMAGTIAWPAAVAKHSQAPSAGEEGELGWIEREAPMPEPFSRAAFALQVGEISPPVVSLFGVHLIRCVEVEPGAKRWQDVSEETRRHAMRYLFDWIVQRQRGQMRIEYTGACPHWDEEGMLVEK